MVAADPLVSTNKIFGIISQKTVIFAGHYTVFPNYGLQAWNTRVRLLSMSIPQAQITFTPHYTVLHTPHFHNNIMFTINMPYKVLNLNIFHEH